MLGDPNWRSPDWSITNNAAFRERVSLVKMAKLAAVYCSLRPKSVLLSCRLRDDYLILLKSSAAIPSDSGCSKSKVRTMHQNGGGVLKGLDATWVLRLACTSTLQPFTTNWRILIFYNFVDLTPEKDEITQV